MSFFRLPPSLLRLTCCPSALRSKPASISDLPECLGMEHLHPQVDSFSLLAELAKTVRLAPSREPPSESEFERSSSTCQCLVEYLREPTFGRAPLNSTTWRNHGSPSLSRRHDEKPPPKPCLARLDRLSKSKSLSSVLLWEATPPRFRHSSCRSSSEPGWIISGKVILCSRTFARVAGLKDSGL